jgi:hypothetical protein
MRAIALSEKFPSSPQFFWTHARFSEQAWVSYPATAAGKLSKGKFGQAPVHIIYHAKSSLM